MAPVGVVRGIHAAAGQPADPRSTHRNDAMKPITWFGTALKKVDARNIETEAAASGAAPDTLSAPADARRPWRG